MLAASKYANGYIAACRKRLASQAAAFNAVATTRRRTQEALQPLEVQLFNDLVIVLEADFVHRTRALELKDGNPLNEVRLLANSLMGNDGVVTLDKTIKYDPGTSVLGYKAGENIQVHESAFIRLAAAFLQDLERKFTRGSPCPQRARCVRLTRRATWRSASGPPANWYVNVRRYSSLAARLPNIERNGRHGYRHSPTSPRASRTPGTHLSRLPRR